MKFQWTLLLGLILAIIVAWFAIVNVDPVPVNYVFGTAEWPLILVILGSALLGAAVSGLVSMFRTFMQKRKIKRLEREVNEKEIMIADQQNEIATLQHAASAFAPEPDAEPRDNNLGGTGR
ncbi:putative integral membrane protein [Bhargavaea cecembensis DSE10]|uniref:Putative integral membrane protein n=1 Tax=Bhargavaea cecembensis DSE10 TaxID=1235279 RepID=M7NF22_9BACL|nr:LapA family protein [Bhargavaea cecembensis]EMR05842.1 putative integral membrane protein [Bhargavaea cecembensis DSE10]